MTDRIKGFTVILEKPMREDDAEVLANSILCLRNVGKVESSICTGDDFMNQEIAKQSLKNTILKQILDLLK